MADDRQQEPGEAGDRDGRADAEGRAGPEGRADTAESMGQTGELPPVRHPPTPPVRPGPWSGRAEVPAGVRGGTPPDWYDEEDYDNGRWWMPILLGVIALFLLAVLGVGVWLIVQASQRGPASEPPPGPTPSATSAPSPVPQRSPTPSPSTTTETPTPRTTTPGAVSMPILVGLPEAVAREVLDQLGLTYQVRFRTVPGWPAGTVIETDPRAGSPVLPSQRVTLVVAEPPSPSAATTRSGRPTGRPTR
ncbi:PASTA domain-containing protein [Micromonospora sp. NPDC003197]